jgi:hypothetical protein
VQEFNQMINRCLSLPDAAVLLCLSLLDAAVYKHGAQLQIPYS